jgi:hypothetical protein
MNNNEKESASNDVLSYLSSVISKVENTNVELVFKMGRVYKRNLDNMRTTAYLHTYEQTVKNLMYEYKYKIMQDYGFDEQAFELWLQLR